MKTKLYIILLFSISLVSCGLLPHPDVFTLDKESYTPIEGTILSDISLADITKDNEFMLYDGGLVSLKRPNVTTSKFSLIAYLRQGDGLKFQLRTDNKKYKTEPGIAFEWTKTGSAVYQNGIKLTETDTVKASDKAAKIVFIQDGGFFSITVDCDTVIKANTKLPANEFLFVGSIGSRALLSAIQMENLFDINRQDLIDTEHKNETRKSERIVFPGNNPR